MVETIIGGLKAVYQAILPTEVRRQIWLFREQADWLQPYALAVVALVIVLERLIPARKDQRSLSVGLVQDFLWYNVTVTIATALLPAYLGFLRGLYNQYLGFLTIERVETWSFGTRLVFSIVVNDFLGWFHHYVRHRVEVFWAFHTIHHSQRQMNLFANGRVHPVEFIIANTLICVPMFMLQLNLGAIAAISIASTWYQNFYHGNIRANLGPLKYVLVTPQSHRIHHSIESRHRDKNLGVLFTVWDRLFGTLYANYDEYPDTGIDDGRFPIEQRRPWWAVPWNWIEQMLYPFRQVVRRLAW